MSYTNNSRSLVNTKLTDKGREKIALGKLNLQSWALGDSEINYVREDFNVDNNITNKPARVLKAVNDQPNLKYYITTSDGTVNQPLNANNVSVRKLNLIGSTQTPWLEDSRLVSGTNTVNPIISIDAINNRIYIADTSDILVGGLFVLEFTNSDNVKQYQRMMVINKGGDSNGYYVEVDQILNDTISFHANSVTNFWTYEPYSPSENQYMTENIDFEWNQDILRYDICDNGLGRTKAWDFNIINVEDVAGLGGKESTYGYDFVGFMENYLSYNDDLNTGSSNEVMGCGDDLVVGQKDDFKRMIGIVHFTNANFSNQFGDSFLIDEMNNRILTLKIRHDSIDLTYLSGGIEKNIIDTDIKYYDLIGGITGKVFGKILPQYKMIVIEDEELIFAMSTFSGRNYTLPMIQTQLVNPAQNTNPLLDAGKQIYVTYSLNNEASNVFKHVHCGYYNVIVNKTNAPKDVNIYFENGAFDHFAQENEAPTIKPIIEGLKVIYQITNVGERPNPYQWLEVDMGSDFGVVPQNQATTLQNIYSANTVIINSQANTNVYDLKTSMFTPNATKFIGDDLLFDGSLEFSYTSAVYQSLVSININPNLFTLTTNPTYNDVNGVKPYITLSEIGLYDNDNDLVMIAKLTRPITFVTNSAIRIEFGLDF